jgi:hypothetical protein
LAPKACTATRAARNAIRFGSIEGG